MACPARGKDVTIETCMRCAALRAMKDDRSYVLCEGQRVEPRLAPEARPV
ncbi:MAG: hypothetical protein KGN00_10960 [Chloroflexota bacterium]|nr:hypothetical protein [Chloroflexota bacterium]MDE3194197.1 hypothetical protein [Chloroflexota bacterium]